MSTDGDEFGRISSAEKQLCDQAGPLIAEIVHGVEERYGIKIRAEQWLVRRELRDSPRR